MEITPQEVGTTTGASLLPQQRADRLRPALSHTVLPRAGHACKTKPGTLPEDTSACPWGEGESRYQVGDSTISHPQTHARQTGLGQGEGVISKAEYLNWVWPQLQAHGQEGPLQNLMCPRRMQVLKSIPTNKLWPHTVRHPRHSPWQILWL